MALTLRRQALLTSDRWSALGAFIERWYAEPPSDSSGYTPLELEQVARRLGTSLPAALVEWYELVGKRLHTVQDSPTRLEYLRLEAGALSIWHENQGNWSVVTPVDAGDDPPCHIDDDSYEWASAPVSRTLLGLTVSDTLIGGWSGTHVGPLGELHGAVRGGYRDDVTAEQLRVLQSELRELDYIQSPGYDEPCLGNETLILRIWRGGIEWLAATDDAYAALDDVLDLEPPGGEYQVVAAFDAVAVHEQDSLRKQLPEIDATRKLLAGIGHIRMVQMAGEDRGLLFQIDSKQPERVVELILASVTVDLVPHLTIARRPIAISVFEVVFPAGKTTFAMPC